MVFEAEDINACRATSVGEGMCDGAGAESMAPAALVPPSVSTPNDDNGGDGDDGWLFARTSRGVQAVTPCVREGNRLGGPATLSGSTRHLKRGVAVEDVEW